MAVENNSNDIWVVRAVSPRDWYQDSTLQVDDWLKKQSHSSKATRGFDAWADFMQAVCAVARHSYWEWDLRDAPCVAYDALRDTHYFVFKIDNNGTTFIVSKRDMVEFDAI